MANIGAAHLDSGTTKIIRDLAARLWHITRDPAPGIWIGRGFDTNRATEHGTGRALDIIVSERVGIMPTPQRKAWGELVVAWLVRHANALHVRHIIWDGRIWKRRYSHTATAWTALRNRSGISDWHRDHIHVFLDDAAGSVPEALLLTPTTTREEDIMASIEDLREVVREALHQANHEKYPSPLGLDGIVAPPMSRTDLLQQDYRQGRGTYETVLKLQQQVAALSALVERALSEGRK